VIAIETSLENQMIKFVINCEENIENHHSNKTLKRRKCRDLIAGHINFKKSSEVSSMNQEVNSMNNKLTNFNYGLSLKAKNKI